MARVDRKLVLEDGSEYYGSGFGASKSRVCEVVFNTSMVGYQEIVSDPSYTYQAVVMTYPLIGNYGMADEDYETKTPTIGALIVGEYNDDPSNFRFTKTLAEILEENDIPGIEGVDTRELTRSLRDHGSRRALITSADTPVEKALRIIRSTPAPHDAVAKVSCKKRWYSRTPSHKFQVVAVDCGIKLSLVRSLNARGCNVTVVPYDTPAEVIVRMDPDGVLLSNGPGDPEDAVPVIELVRQLRGKVTIFGIGLGHQLMALACGGRTCKLQRGHRGANHPVKDLKRGTIEIVSQDHGYAVDGDSLAGTGLEITHIDLLDNTVQGLASPGESMFSVQFHPDGTSGPRGSADPFDQFIENIRRWKDHA